MNVYYCVGFDVSKSGGKSRATRQKIKCLNDNFSYVKVFSPKGGTFVAFQLIFLEFYILFKVLANKPDYVISRGWIGFIIAFLSKKQLIRTKCVREVHADLLEEIDLINKPFYTKFLFKIFAVLLNKCELISYKLIFNHPDLELLYISKYKFEKETFSCFNGFGWDGAKSKKQQSDLKNKYNIDSDKPILAFTGSVSAWHGIDYIIDLAKELNNDGVQYQLIIAGGKVNCELPPNVMNISPLDSEGCNEIISIADVCLLPVKKNRQSPGSPLKLYDYIKSKKFILAQENTKGYSDEVQLYGFGSVVDFSNSKLSSIEVQNILRSENYINNGLDLNVDKFTWKVRLEAWFEFVMNDNEK